MNEKFWRGRNVLLTGHTGFKGSWMALLLEEFGANVTGVSLESHTSPSLWNELERGFKGKSCIVDIRDNVSLHNIVTQTNPDVAIHMAAQAQVKQSYLDPYETYSTNVMGTVNFLESLKSCSNLKVAIVVTSDKVYLNQDSGKPFREDDALGGSDPYSASKSAADLIAKSYAESFFASLNIKVVTARGGNVIGGGDWSSDRLIPDIYRSAVAKTPVELRYPDAYRPWQHVLDCVSGYLIYAETLCSSNANAPRALNFGPNDDAKITVAEIANSIGAALGNNRAWVASDSIKFPEKQTLALNTELARKVLNWSPRLNTSQAVEWTTEWYSDFAKNKSAPALSKSQIEEFLSL